MQNESQGRKGEFESESLLCFAFPLVMPPCGVGGQTIQKQRNSNLCAAANGTKSILSWILPCFGTSSCPVTAGWGYSGGFPSGVSSSAAPSHSPYQQAAQLGHFLRVFLASSSSHYLPLVRSCEDTEHTQAPLVYTFNSFCTLLTVQSEGAQLYEFPLSADTRAGTPPIRHTEEGKKKGKEKYATGCKEKKKNRTTERAWKKLLTSSNC